MEYMFYETKLFNQPIGKWDVSCVTNMYRIFYIADNFDLENAPWYHK